GQSFPSALAGEQITVHLPESDDSLYLAQPVVLRGRVGHDDRDVWGELSPGGTFAGIQRLGFTADLSDVAVVEDNMREWVRRVRAWLDMATGQAETALGAIPPRVWKNRTCLFHSEDDGAALSDQSVMPGFDPMYELNAGLATRDTLRTVFELAGAGTELPMPWVLLRDARALHRVTHTRRAVMECGSAAESANVRLLTNNGVTVPAKATLGETFKMLKKLSYPLPSDYDPAFLKVRNREVHMLPGHGFVSEAESTRILEITTSLVEAAFPLPSTLKRLG